MRARSRAPRAWLKRLVAPLPVTLDQDIDPALADPMSDRDLSRAPALQQTPHPPHTAPSPYQPPFVGVQHVPRHQSTMSCNHTPSSTPSFAFALQTHAGGRPDEMSPRFVAATSSQDTRPAFSGLPVAHDGRYGCARWQRRVRDAVSTRCRPPCREINQSLLHIHSLAVRRRRRTIRSDHLRLC